MLRNNERICKRCHAIINLEEHKHYVTKSGQRKTYYCTMNCVIDAMQVRYKADYLTHKELIDKFIGQDFIEVN